MLKELLPEPKPRWIGDTADGLGFKLFKNRLVTKGLVVGAHGCTMDLFITLTLEEETGIFKAKLQQCSNVWNGDGGPVM